jgi:hypothetical protein
MRLDRRHASSDRARRLQTELAEAVSVEGVDGRVCSENCAILCPTVDLQPVNVPAPRIVRKPAKPYRWILTSR